MAATDGSCTRNPGGAGGWAYVIADGRCGYGSEAVSTNNRMEVLAVLALLSATDPSLPLHICVDSLYVKNMCEKWLPGWLRRGMLTAGGQPVKNQDLVVPLHHALASRPVSFEWVRGHAEHVLNTRADLLAGYAARGQLHGQVG